MKSSCWSTIKSSSHWFFGVFKQKHRRNVYHLNDIHHLLSNQSVLVNNDQLVYTTVKIYGCSNFAHIFEKFLEREK